MTIDAACQHYGITRQAYYQQNKALLAKAAKANAVVALVYTQRIKQPNIGARKLDHLLKPSMNQITI
jgi:putative transposase